MHHNWRHHTKKVITKAEQALQEEKRKLW